MIVMRKVQDFSQLFKWPSPLRDFVMPSASGSVQMAFHDLAIPTHNKAQSKICKPLVSY